MERTFTFVHGPTQTNFGSATIEVVGTVLVNGQEMGPNATAHLIGYMAQSLQDKYAGVGKSKTVAEAQAAFDTHLEKLLNDTVGVSSGRQAVDDETAAKRTIVRRILKARKDERLAAAKDQPEILDDIWDDIYAVESNVETLDAALAARLEEMETERKAAAKRKAQAASLSVSIEI